MLFSDELLEALHDYNWCIEHKAPSKYMASAQKELDGQIRYEHIKETYVFIVKQVKAALACPCRDTILNIMGAVNGVYLQAGFHNCDWIIAPKEWDVV